MAVYSKYKDFAEQVLRGKHNFGAHVFKVALSNGVPDANHTSLADISELATGNGYTTGGVTVTMNLSESGGIATVVATDPSAWTASGTGITFRYAALYNDSATSPVDALIAYWDNGGSTTVSAGNPVRVDFGVNLLTLS